MSVETPQFMTALARANEVRLARAALRHRVAAGETTVAVVVLDPPPEAERMPLMELLMAQRRWGRERALRLLGEAVVRESKLLGELTDRQRRVVASLLRAGR